MQGVVCLPRRKVAGAALLLTVGCLAFAGTSDQGRARGGLASSGVVSADVGQGWLLANARHGVVEAGEGGRKTYLCPSPEQARRVIAAIPAMVVSQQGLRAKRQINARDRALRAQDCWRVRLGAYPVLEVHETAFVSAGLDLVESWTALTALDRNGGIVGLLHDANAPDLLLKSR